MDGQPPRGVDRTLLVDRLAHHVEDATQHAFADRHRDGPAGALDRLAADQAVGRVHRDAARGVLAQVLGHLDGQVVRLVGDAGVRERLGGEDLRQRAGRKFHVHHRPDHLRDLAHFRRFVNRYSHWDLFALTQRGHFSASAPETISISSLVIDAWRARLYWSESRPIISLALLVAESIAVIRAPCSDASDSSSARQICIASCRGIRCSSSAGREGSYRCSGVMNPPSPVRCFEGGATMGRSWVSVIDWAMAERNWL